MKTWKQLLVRHGWNLEQLEENTFHCENELTENVTFLCESLDTLGVTYNYDNNTIEFIDQPVSEDDLIKVLDFEFRGRTEMIGVSKDSNGPEISRLDTYISGFVRQLNRLGFHTTNSCDGHGRRRAHVSVTKNSDIKKLEKMLLALGGSRVHCQETRSSFDIRLFISQQSELLDLAEKMSGIDIEWLNKDSEYIEVQFFLKKLEQLLRIPGVSGNEDKVRNVVKEKLAPYVDYLSVDRSGNLLAEKTYRTGNGPTILLNAHLDIVDELVRGRAIMKEEGIWRSSQGILGADDRAGVAVLLHMAEKLVQSTYSGKVKFIFTVGEERGLEGARKVDDYFLWGTDAAFVIDRRGNSDIVTSCFGAIPFCDARFGSLIEGIANNAGLDTWKCTSGGSSDTKVWAEHGIQCVNLSAGYDNEHTEDEYLDVKACYNVTKLLSVIFEQSREVRRITREIRMERRISDNNIGEIIV